MRATALLPEAPWRGWFSLRWWVRAELWPWGAKRLSAFPHPQQRFFEQSALRAEIQPHELRRAELRARRHRHPMLEELRLRVRDAEA